VTTPVERNSLREMSGWSKKASSQILEVPRLENTEPRKGNSSLTSQKADQSAQVDSDVTSALKSTD
jgi:hypothetical protein